MLGFLLASSVLSSCDAYTGITYTATLDIDKATDNCVLVTNCIFQNIQSQASGACIYMSTLAQDLNLTVSGSFFQDCKSYVDGGGIAFNGMSITVKECCAIDVFATFGASFISVTNHRDGDATVEYTTALHCISQMNVLQFHNGDATASNINMTACKGTMGNIAIYAGTCDSGNFKYLDIYRCKGRSQGTSVFYMTSTHTDPIMSFDTINVIGTTQTSGRGSIFVTQINTEVRRLVALENSLDMIDAIRYKVYFIDCVWDSQQEVWTDLVVTEDFRSNTVTSTYDLSLYHSEGCIYYTEEAEVSKARQGLEVLYDYIKSFWKNMNPQ